MHTLRVLVLFRSQKKQRMAMCPLQSSFAAVYVMSRGASMRSVWLRMFGILGYELHH